MATNFSTAFHVLKPGLRVSGKQISVVFVGAYDKGLYKGKPYIHIDLTDEDDLTFVEEPTKSGPLESVTSASGLYDQLKAAGMTELFSGFLLDPDDLSMIDIGAEGISFDFEGHEPYVFKRNPDASVVLRTKYANQSWMLPQSEFSSVTTVLTNAESPLELELQSIEARFQSQEGEDNAIDARLDVLEADPITATAVNDLIATGMWLFPDQAAFPAAADNHGRVVHSHADGAMYYAHGGTWNKIESEAEAEAARTALQTAINTNTGGIATEITNRQAGDTAALSSANTYTDTKISDLVNGAGPALDTLKELSDALTGNDDDIAALLVQIGNVEVTATANTTGLATEVSQRQAAGTAEATARIAEDTALRTDFENADTSEATARTTADAALDTRVTAIEGSSAISDPTTATAVAAVQSDVDQNETDADAADAALSGRLDVLEADPTTQTLLDAETAARVAGDDALRSELFPAPACEYQDIQATVSAGDYNTAQDGKLHYDAATKKLYIPNDLRKAGTPPNQTNVWPYGSLGAPLPPNGSIYINLVGNVVTYYANDSGVVYAQLTDDISALLDTEIVIRWCAPDPDLPYVLPEELDVEIARIDALQTAKADKDNPDFTGQVDIDTNARIEFASNLTKIHNVLRGTSIDIGNNIELKPAAAGGRVEITGDLVLDASDITDAADDTAAAAAGVIVGQVYRNGSQLMVRVS